MTKPKTPERIYLIDSGEGIVWCDEPAPGEDMKGEDAVEYVRADLLSKPVATVDHYTQGSYQRNYKVRWHKDVAAGTQLFALPVGQMGAQK